MWQRAGLLLLCCISPALAAPPGEKPMADQELVGNAVTQPLSDINLKKREIPALLASVREDPYALEGIRNCRQVAFKIAELDTVLGPDFDQFGIEDRTQVRKESASRIAGSVISSFVPFRGIIREISGANKTDQDYREAIYAGAVRRAFLKGLGQQRRCRAPARPLTDREREDQAMAVAAKVDAPVVKAVKLHAPDKAKKPRRRKKAKE